MSTASFARRLLAWREQHGRRDLPWQTGRSAYRVWVSEIMLQQTRVATVIPYFQRFVARYPDVAALADAPDDEVLHAWSGLGYYSRARNLHAAAKRVVAEAGGRLPRTLDGWLALPGVGRSTAGAVLALTHGHRYPILDGNVRRVLCRYHGIDTWPGEPSTEKALWRLADEHTPASRVAEYSQAIMDLGATVCRRRKPRCADCPLKGGCRARANGSADRIPARKPAKARPLRATRFLILCRRNRSVMLVKRPPAGVWGGLWSFPECGPKEEPASVCRERFGLTSTNTRYLAPRRHGFTHFELDIEPVLLDVDAGRAGGCGMLMDAGPVLWYNSASPARLGIATPVRALLDELT